MKKILIFGGGSYQIPLIKRVNSLGMKSFCLDKNSSALGFEFASESAVIDLLDKDACLDYAIKIEPDAVLTYGATLPLPTVSYIGEQLGLPVLPYETAMLSMSKYKIKERLFQNGCNIYGGFFILHSADEINQRVVEFPCVVKPCDGSGSKGVSIVHSAGELSSAVTYAFEAARYGEVYCEKFVDGEEYSVESFVNKGKAYIYGIIKTTFQKSGKANESIEYGHRTPSGLSADDEKTIEVEILKAIRALDITMGSVNFDVILSKEDRKPYIIDCGIRIGQNLIASHIIPLSRGVNILDNTIKLALNEEINAEPVKRENIATRLLIYNPGTIREIRDYSDIIGTGGVMDVVMRKSVGEIQRPYIDKSDTCGWVICTGATPETAEKNAIEARKQLKDYIIIE